MFTNQKILAVILIVVIIGASAYFAVSKFKQQIGEVNASPSPSPSPSLTFVFNQFSTPTPIPTGKSQNIDKPTKTIAKSTPQPTSSELPLARKKQVGQFPGILKAEVLQNKKAVIVTAKGNIEFEIFPDVPQGASNFMILAANGFYDGLTFHRRVPDFVIQGGDPLGNGTGGPGYTFADEPVNREYKRGIVAYANAGPNTNSSQFFILLSDQPNLPKKYTIFGNVISGMEVVDKITEGDLMQKVVIQNR